MGVQRSRYRRRQKESPAERGLVDRLGRCPTPRRRGWASLSRSSTANRLYRIDHFRKIHPDRATGRDFRNPPPAAASTSARSAPLGPVASSGALRAVLAASIGQVPRILDAKPAAARCHHALLERGKAQVVPLSPSLPPYCTHQGRKISAPAGWASIANVADASTANATRVMIMTVLA